MSNDQERQTENARGEERQPGAIGGYLASLALEELAEKLTAQVTHWMKPEVRDSYRRAIEHVLRANEVRAPKTSDPIKVWAMTTAVSKLEDWTNEKATEHLALLAVGRDLKENPADVVRKFALSVLFDLAEVEI